LDCGRIQVSRIIGGDITVNVRMPEDYGKPLVNPGIARMGKINLEVS